jgi:hypothetical protein
MMRSLRERFDAKWRVGPLAWDGTPCWIWTASTNKAGYGLFWDGNRLLPAHRVAYQLYVGPIPAGLETDHRCRRHPCVNPAHLEPVTHRVNVLRGVCPSALNAVATHCIHGHAFDASNTRVYTRKDGGIDRQCRQCHRDRGRRRRRLACTLGPTPQGALF